MLSIKTKRCLNGQLADTERTYENDVPGDEADGFDLEEAKT